MQFKQIYDLAIELGIKADPIGSRRSRKGSRCGEKGIREA